MVRVTATEDRHWEMLVNNMLRSGFGVEDIAVTLRKLKAVPCDARSVRDHVRRLREEGTLLSIYRRTP